MSERGMNKRSKVREEAVCCFGMQLVNYHSRWCVHVRVCICVCVCETQRAQEVEDEWRAEARATRPPASHGPLLPVSLSSWTDCLLPSLTGLSTRLTADWLKETASIHAVLKCPNLLPRWM